MLIGNMRIDSQFIRSRNSVCVAYGVLTVHWGEAGGQAGPAACFHASLQCLRHPPLSERYGLASTRLLRDGSVSFTDGCQFRGAIIFFHRGSDLRQKIWTRTGAILHIVFKF